MASHFARCISVGAFSLVNVQPQSSDIVTVLTKSCTLSLSTTVDHYKNTHYSQRAQQLCVEKVSPDLFDKLNGIWIIRRSNHPSCWAWHLQPWLVSQLDYVAVTSVPLGICCTPCKPLQNIMNANRALPTVRAGHRNQLYTGQLRLCRRYIQYQHVLLQ